MTDNTALFEQLKNLAQTLTFQGVSPKTAVFHCDKVTLYKYCNTEQSPLTQPQPAMLLCFSLVNTPYILDIHRRYSMVRELLDLGCDVYVIDWGFCDISDRYLTLEDYICVYLHRCVQYVKRQNQQVHLVGVCQGGTLSLCYAAWQTDQLTSLTTMITPVDFAGHDTLLNLWTADLAISDQQLAQTFALMPGNLLNALFGLLKPYANRHQKYLSLLKHNETAVLELFLSMEYWLNQSPNLAGSAWAEFIEHFYRKNCLVEGGFTLNNKAIALNNITVPVLNITALHDHIVAADSSMALSKYIQPIQLCQLSFPVGHIGIYTSKKSTGKLAPAIAARARETIS
jgi:polyhydroxyalkanoate synthase